MITLSVWSQGIYQTQFKWKSIQGSSRINSWVYEMFVEFWGNDTPWMWVPSRTWTLYRDGHFFEPRIFSCLLLVYSILRTPHVESNSCIILIYQLYLRLMNESDSPKPFWNGSISYFDLEFPKSILSGKALFFIEHLLRYFLQTIIIIVFEHNLGFHNFSK